MKNINLTAGEKENAILALKHYRDFLLRVEEAIWQDDAAWIVEQLRSPVVYDKLLKALCDLYTSADHLVRVEIQEGEEP